MTEDTHVANLLGPSRDAQAGKKRTCALSNHVVLVCLALREQASLLPVVCMILDVLVIYRRKGNKQYFTGFRGRFN